VKNVSLAFLILTFCSMVYPNACKADLVFSIAQNSPAGNGPLLQGVANAGLLPTSRFLDATLRLP
jgi:hypothetical protein